MATANVEDAEIDAWWLVDRTGHGKQQLPDRLDGADLAVVMACLDPGAVFVRERGGGGTSVMRHEADGAWYFVE